MPPKDGKSVSKQRVEGESRTREGPRQEGMWARTASLLVQKGRLSGRGHGPGSQAHKPCVSRCLSPGCLRPFPSGLLQSCSVTWKLLFFPELAFHSWQGAPALSQRLSVSSSSPLQQGEYISLRLCAPTYLEFAGSRRFSCVGFGTSSSLSYFCSIWARNMPTRISLDFFFLTPGLRPKGGCTQTLWVSSPITAPCLLPCPPHTSHWAVGPWGVVPTCGNPSY